MTSPSIAVYLMTSPSIAIYLMTSPSIAIYLMTSPSIAVYKVDRVYSINLGSLFNDILSYIGN